MRKELIIAALAGAVCALLFVLPVANPISATILVVLVMVPLFLAGLSLGVAGALTASVTALLVVGVVGSSLQPDGSIVSLVLFFGFAFALPVVVLTRQALLNRSTPDGTEWYPPGLLLTWLAGLGGVLATAIILLGIPFDAPTEGRFLQSMSDQIAEAYGLDRDAAIDIANNIWQTLPGLLTASCMMIAITNGALAQGALVRFGKNMRPSPKMADIRLPSFVIFLFGAAILAMMLPGLIGRIGLIATIILSIPIMFQGLAIVHMFAQRFPMPLWFLATFYILLAIFNWMTLAFVLLGIIDQWADIRRRLARSGSGQEDD